MDATIEPTSLQPGKPGNDGIPTLQAGMTPQSSATSTAGLSGHSTSTNTTPAATGVRQRINSLSDQLDAATEHPAVKNVKVTAQKQVGSLRERLGRSPQIVNLEKRTGFDRVVLVVGGILAYVSPPRSVANASSRRTKDILTLGGQIHCPHPFQPLWSRTPRDDSFDARAAQCSCPGHTRPTTFTSQ